MNTKNYGFAESLRDNRSVQLDCEAQDWQSAIKVTFLPLIQAKKITEDYIAAVIASTIKHGPYYIIGPNLAMPHADLSEAVNATAFSLAVFKAPVVFNEGNSARVLVGFASPNKNEHLAFAIPQIIAVFENPAITEKMMVANSVAEIMAIIDSVDQNKYLNLNQKK